jgi:dUTP pyrophosphatase
MTKHPITLGAGQVELIHTGISIYINNPGYAGLVLPRSGLGHHLGVVLGNLVGLIDSDFQGEIMLSVWNRGTKSVRIDVGDRIAQLVLIPVVQARLQLTTEFAESGRGLQGLSELNAATCAQ